MPLEAVEGPVRSGALIQDLMGDQGEVVGTLVCGDNYANEETEATLKAAGEALDRFNRMSSSPVPPSTRAGMAWPAERSESWPRTAG